MTRFSRFMELAQCVAGDGDVLSAALYVGKAYRTQVDAHGFARTGSTQEREDFAKACVADLSKRGKVRYAVCNNRRAVGTRKGRVVFV